MKEKINLSTLLKEGFMPLTESKEGVLKGGFAALSVEVNNCNCSTIGNDCKCQGNFCNPPLSTINTNCTCGSGSLVDNCNCKDYGALPSESSSESSSDSSTTPTPPVPSETQPSFTDLLA